MADNKYDAIFCDLGNVLINFDHRLAVKRLLEHTPKNEEYIYNLFFDSPLTKFYEEGKITSREFFDRVKAALHLAIGYDELLPIWNEIFFETSLNIKLHGLLRKHKPMIKLAVISNINETHFAFLRPKLPILKEFDKLILSYEVGARKPAPEIYKAASDSINVGLERAFYIDDRKDLIEYASSLGIKGIVFDGEIALEKIAEELGE